MMKGNTVSPNNTSPMILQDLTDLELGEDDPNGIEIISPRSRLNHKKNEKNNIVDTTESTLLKPSSLSLSSKKEEHADLELGGGGGGGGGGDAGQMKSELKLHGFWLLSNQTFTFLQMSLNVFILLSMLLQLAMIGVKVKRLYHSNKYGLLFLILLTSLVNVIVAIWVLYGQYLFHKVPRLRQLINGLRMEVNRFMKENNILSHTITKLEQDQERLHDVEQKLQIIVTSQGGNVQQFKTLVQENATIVQRQKQILKEQWKQEIIATVLRTDRNGDFVITDNEVDMLLRRIVSLEEDAGITLSVEEQNKLRCILTTGNITEGRGGKIGSVRALIELIGHALED